MDDKKIIHFVCGLPRSGSTLLCNLLAQHPDVHTTPTSACHEALFVLRNNWNQWTEHKASPKLADDKNLQRVLNATLHAYHDTDKPVVFDKGRGWGSLLETAEFALGRKAKVLVPVRSIKNIVASMEKVHRKAAHHKQDNGDYIKAQTVEGRADMVLSEAGVLGLAYNRLKDVAQRGMADRLCLVDFDILTSKPKESMDEIWSFLEMVSPNHDFNNVEQVTFEDDSVHGLDLHTIRSKVEPVKDDSEEILGKSLCKKLDGTEFWRI
jgi:sulfotransferase